MKVLVIGDSCVDRFVYGDCKRICPEAPVPVFNPKYTKENPGMAANVGENLKALGVEVVHLLTNPERIVKTRYVDQKSNQLIVRVDEGDVVAEAAVLNRFTFDNYDCLICSDYDKGFLRIEDLLLLSSRHGCTFLDTKKVLGKWAQNFSFIKINEPEYEHSKKWSKELFDIEHKLIVTMSERGASYCGQVYPVENPSEIRDVSGAGDAFLAGLAVEYLKTNNIEMAIRFANICAAKAVSKKGISVI